MRLVGPSEGVSVIVDGRVVCRLEEGDRVVVQRSDTAFQLVEPDSDCRTYYQTLREKLGWYNFLTTVSCRVV